MTLEEKEKAIIEHYNVMPQLKYFQSEIFELNEAIIRKEYLPNEKDVDEELFAINMEIEQAKEDVIEEIADVQLMLNQFKRYYNISDKEIEEVMQYKADRQLKRIDKEKRG